MWNTLLTILRKQKAQVILGELSKCLAIATNRSFEDQGLLLLQLDDALLHRTLRDETHDGDWLVLPTLLHMTSPRTKPHLSVLA